jgi:hypothetical protein
LSCLGLGLEGEGSISGVDVAQQYLSPFRKTFPPSSLSLEPLSWNPCLVSVPFVRVLAHRGSQLLGAETHSRGSAIISVSENDPLAKGSGLFTPELLRDREKIGDILKERRLKVSKWGTMRYVGHRYMARSPRARQERRCPCRPCLPSPWCLCPNHLDLSHPR